MTAMQRSVYLPGGVFITPPQARELVLEALHAETAKIISHTLTATDTDVPVYEIVLIADKRLYRCKINAVNGKIMDLSAQAA